MPTTRYVYNPLTEAYLAETDGDGNLTVKYTQEPVKYGDILAQHRIDPATGVGKSYYYHPDALGSTRELTDESGTVVATYNYDAFGNTIAKTGTVENPFRFTGNVGYYWDEEFDTYHIRARNFEPTTGRWTSQDPIGFVDGPNLYVAFFIPFDTDPSGLSPEEQSPDISCEVIAAAFGEWNPEEGRTSIKIYCTFRCKCPPGSNRQYYTSMPANTYYSDNSRSWPANKDQAAKRACNSSHLLDAAKINARLKCGEPGEDNPDPCPLPDGRGKNKAPVKNPPPVVPVPPPVRRLVPPRGTPSPIPRPTPLPTPNPRPPGQPVRPIPVPPPSRTLPLCFPLFLFIPDFIWCDPSNPPLA